MSVTISFPEAPVGAITLSKIKLPKAIQTPEGRKKWRPVVRQLLLALNPNATPERAQISDYPMPDAGALGDPALRPILRTVWPLFQAITKLNASGAPALPALPPEPAAGDPLLTTPPAGPPVIQPDGSPPPATRVTAGADGEAGADDDGLGYTYETIGLEDIAADGWGYPEIGADGAYTDQKKPPPAPQDPQQAWVWQESAVPPQWLLQLNSETVKPANTPPGAPILGTPVGKQAWDWYWSELLGPTKRVSKTETGGGWLYRIAYPTRGTDAGDQGLSTRKAGGLARSAFGANFGAAIMKAVGPWWGLLIGACLAYLGLAAEEGQEKTVSTLLFALAGLFGAIAIFRRRQS